MTRGQSNAVLRYVHKVAFLLERDQMTDGQLLGHFLAQKDEAAFEVLMRRHGPMVLSVCRRVLANAHDVEDAFQATFLVLVRKAASIKNREQVGNWLYGAAYRAALEARTARRRTRESQVPAVPEPIAPATEGGADLGPVLDQELSRLPDKFRVPVVLCDLEGRTRREAARQLGVPEGTLSGRLTTARRRLAQQLARRGVVLSAAGLATALAESSAAAGVPVPLAVTTVKAVTAVAAGQTATAGLVSAQVAALTEGVVKTMLVMKLKSMSVVLLSVALLGGGGTLLTYHALGAERAAAGQEALVQAASPGGEEARPVQDKKEEPPKAEERTYGFLGVMLAWDDDMTHVLLHEVFPDSPAAKAGLKVGDMLLRIGTTEVHGPQDAVQVLKSSKPGGQMALLVKRRAEEIKATVTLGTWPAEEKGPTTANQAGGAKDEKAAGYLGLILRDDPDKGLVIVHELAADSPAAKAGIKPEDVLLKVGDVQAKRSEDVIKKVGGLKTGDQVTLRIKRGDKEMDVTITAAKRPADFGKM